MNLLCSQKPDILGAAGSNGKRNPSSFYTIFASAAQNDARSVDLNRGEIAVDPFFAKNLTALKIAKFVTL
jgi:hypothetical protein